MEGIRARIADHRLTGWVIVGDEAQYTPPGYTEVRAAIVFEGGRYVVKARNADTNRVNTRAYKTVAGAMTYVVFITQP